MEEIISRFQGDPAVREELLARLEELRRKVALLDLNEPEDMESEEYEAWGDTHEKLEDQIDEILDFLDEI